MSKNFSITLMILAAIAIGSTLFLRQADATVLNQNFRIETLYGDENLINDIFEISTIRQEGANSFSRVVLTTNEPEITPIRFDARHQLDERQLENREFYRGTHVWARSTHNRNETENFRMLWIHNWPNASTLNILNKETGAFASFEDVDSSNHFQNWTMSFFLEKEDILYQVVAEEGRSHARIYRADFGQGRFVFDFDIRQDSEAAGSWFATANHIYFYEMGGWVHSPQGWSDWVDNPSEATGGFDPETGVDTLTASGRPMYAINFETGRLEPRQSPVGIANSWSRGHWGDYFIHEGIVTYDEQGQLGNFDRLSLINLELGHRYVFLDTAWNDWHETQQNDGWGMTSHWWTEHYIMGDYLVATIRIDEFLQFINIYALDAKTLIYRGRINIRRDQGILTNDWGQVSGFGVRLRD